MLVLTRSEGESIFIDGQKIKVQILIVNGGQVRLGITAPDDISIDREEIYERKQRGTRDDEKAYNRIIKNCT